MKSKRQTTIAKREREKLVQERRDLKRQKKEAAAAAARDGESPSDGSGAEDASAS